jgi:hypothetical protein
VGADDHIHSIALRGVDELGTFRRVGAAFGTPNGLTMF